MATYAQVAINGGGTRLEMTRRILVLIGLLSPLRNGATLPELAQDVSLENGQVAERTVQRDLTLLMDMGLVVRTLDDGSRVGGKRYRWTWNRNGSWSNAVAAAAEQFAEYELESKPAPALKQHPWRAKGGV